MRKHDHLPDAATQPVHLLHRREPAVIVQACHGIIDDDDLFRQAGVLIEGGEEEREREGVAIASAERVLERWAAIGGQGDRHAVDEHAVAGGRPAPIVHRRDGA